MNNQVKHFVIDDEFEITERMLELHALNPERSVLAVGYYETIISIANDLLKCSDDLFMIEAEIMPPEFDGYEEGFYCEVSDDEIWVGRTHWEGQDKMKIFEADITFCEEDFVDDYVVRNGVDGLVVFGFDDVCEDDEDEECDDDADVNICWDENHCGFCCCFDDEYGHHTFEYRTNRRLSDDDAWDIITERFDFEEV